MTDVNKIPIDAKLAVDLVGRAAIQRGINYKYPREERGGGCFYWNAKDNQPDCIVGFALHLAGWPAEAIARLDHAGPVGVDVADLPECITPEAVQVFHVAQNAQDAHISWGGSYEKALADYNEKFAGSE